MDLGIVGNCQFNALIDRNANVRWLCWPRFDDPFIFGSLLDEGNGGEFSITSASAAETTQEYLPNTNILRTVFRDGNDSFEVVDFAPRFQQYDRYYKPTMLIRRVRPLGGEPRIVVNCDPRRDYGRLKCDSRLGSNHIQFLGFNQEVRLTTNASLAMITENKPFVLDRNYYFALTYGQPLEDKLEETCDSFLHKTRQYWHRWVKHCYLPRRHQREVIRSALVLKLHQYEDTGAIIAATTTSIPEAEGTVRNWDYRYCWLRDALFSLGALQRLTHHEEMERFTVYLRNIVATMKAREERLQPVYGVSGESELTEHILDHLPGYKGHQPVRIGNQAFEHKQHDVYGEMILAISRLYLDIRFDSGEHDRARLVKTLLELIENHLETPDAGLWEFRGKEQIHTFTVLMHWAGATVAEAIGESVQDSDLESRGRDLAKRAAKILEEKCFDKELGVFTQAAGNKTMDACLLMLVNLGYLHQDDPRAVKQIEKIVDDLGTKEGLLHRYLHKDDFGETANTFTICSFWLVEALARVGRNDEAARLFRKLLGHANHLGLYSEDLNPKTGEQWGNFPQTYSHVGLINAAFSFSDDASLPGLWDFNT